MTRAKRFGFLQLVPVFKTGLSMMILISAMASFAMADEGTAVADKSGAADAAAQNSGQALVPSATESDSGAAKSHWWDKFQDINIKGLKPRIRPHFYADNSYNSNATLLRKETSAWQARVSPGITVDLPFNERLYSSVDYTYSFSTVQGKNLATHANTHNVDAIVRYDLAKKTALGVRNNAQWSELPGSPGNTFFLETVNPEIKHDFGTKLSTGLQYIFQHYHDVTNAATGGASDFFRGGSSNDTFDDNGVKATSEYKLGSGLTLGPSFGWNVREFTKFKSKNYWQITPTLNGTYTLGAKTKLGAYFGWAYRRFDVGDGYESDLVYGAKLTHLLGRKFVWEAGYDKSLTDTFDTSFVFRPGTAQATDLDNFDRHFRVIRNQKISTGLTYNINEKNSANVSSAFQFSNADSNDNVFSNDRLSEKKMDIGAGYLYRLTRYISLQLAYEFGRSFEARDNPARSAYTFHKVTAGVNVAF